MTVARRGGASTLVTQTWVVRRLDARRGGASTLVTQTWVVRRLDARRGVASTLVTQTYLADRAIAWDVRAIAWDVRAIAWDVRAIAWDVRVIAAFRGACIFLRTSTERDLTANSVDLVLGINTSLTVSIGSVHTGRAGFHTANIF